MATIDPNQLRPGMKITCDGGLWTVTEWNLRTPGNLRSFVVTKLKNLLDGRVVEKTFRGGAEHPEEADVEQRTATFLYSDGDGYHFMDTQSYDQFQIPAEVIGFQKNFLIPDSEVQILYWNGKAVSTDFPAKIVLTVKDTMENVVKGNTSGPILKDATLETGFVAQVPAFIKVGDKVRLSTEDGSYIERVN